MIKIHIEVENTETKKKVSKDFEIPGLIISSEMLHKFMLIVIEIMKETYGQ